MGRLTFSNKVLIIVVAYLLAYHILPDTKERFDSYMESTQEK